VGSARQIGSIGGRGATVLETTCQFIGIGFRLLAKARKRAAPLPLLCLGLRLDAAPLPPAAPDALRGPWSGRVHYGDESKRIGLRFEAGEKNSLVAFADAPELKFHNVGPIPVQREGERYVLKLNSYHTITLQVESDRRELRGDWVFDGHHMPFELKPGALPPEHAPERVPGPVAQPAWTFKTGGPIWSSPAVAEDTVYFGSSDGIIHALRADSGKPLWQFKTGGRVMGHPTLQGLYLYELSDDGYLYKLERSTGTLVWQFDTHGGGIPRSMAETYDYMSSAATVVDGTIYIGSADKRLYAIDDDSGRERWHFATEGIVRSTPAVADGRIFFGSWDHHVYAVDVNTGALKWKYDTLREIVSSPLVVNGTVYVGSRCADLFAIDAATGNVKWRYFYWSSWVESSARSRDGILYVGSSDLQRLFAIDATTGKEVWSFDTDGSAWSTPAVTDTRVYIGAAGVIDYFIPHHGAFFAVDRSTGHAVWHYPMKAITGSDTYGVASSPAVDKGLVFFGGLDGTFYAFRTGS
jgi:outer membrane protein assembly factor BamB